MLSRICCCVCVVTLWGSSARCAEPPVEVPTPPAPQSKLPPVPPSPVGAVFQFLSSDAFASEG